MTTNLRNRVNAPASEKEKASHQTPATDHQPLSLVQWYALYTRPRHEKVVAQQLGRQQIEAFLPLREVLSRWKDRRKLVQLPLFPGYVFVRTLLTRKREVVSTNGVVGMVSFRGTPAPIPDEQIEAVRDICLTKLPCDPYPYLTEGRWVRIIRGPLTGLTGILVRKKGKHRLVVSIDILRQSVGVEIDADSAIPVDW